MSSSTPTSPAGPPSPGPLMQLGLAYRSSAVLFAALDLELFTLLAEGPKTADALAEAVQGKPSGMRLLLDACVSEGLLTADGERYSNTPVTAAFLVKGKEGYSANAFKYAQNLVPAWSRLADFVKDGVPPMLPQVMLGENKAVTRAFVMGMHERAKGIGSILSHLVDLTGRKHLLDVGGGPGTYSVSLCEQTPGLRSTVLDVPGVLEVSKELVEAAGYADRVSLRPGDYLSSDFGTGYDAALLSGMMHRETQENCKHLLRKAFAALDPGGLAMVSDVFFDDETHRTPAFAVYFALNMALTSHDGAAHAMTEMADWMREIGFVDVEIKPLPKPNPHTLVTGRKP